MTTEITEAEYFAFLETVSVAATPVRERILEHIVHQAKIAAAIKDHTMLATRNTIAAALEVTPAGISKYLPKMIADGEIQELVIAGKHRFIPVVEEKARPNAPRKARAK